MELPIKIELRKERSFSDKMNGMFTYLSQNIKVIFRCFLFIVAPVALLSGICNGIYQSQLMQSITYGIRNEAGNNFFANPDYFSNLISSIFSPFYLLVILFSISSSVLVKCIVFSHFRLYAGSPAREVTFEEVWDDVKKNFIRIFFSVIVATIIIAVGFLLFLIPGIYLLVAISMILPVMIIEGAGFSDALNRSFFLISGKWWSTFGLLFITLIIVYIGSLIFSLPMIIFRSLVGIGVVGNEVAIWQILSSVISSVGIMFIFSLFSFAIGMQYFNLVERREGKGLRSYIDEIGNTQTAENNSNDFDL